MLKVIELVKFGAMCAFGLAASLAIAAPTSISGTIIAGECPAGTYMVKLYARDDPERAGNRYYKANVMVTKCIRAEDGLAPKPGQEARLDLVKDTELKIKSLVP